MTPAWHTEQTRTPISVDTLPVVDASLEKNTRENLSGLTRALVDQEGGISAGSQRLDNKYFHHPQNFPSQFVKVLFCFFLWENLSVPEPRPQSSVRNKLNFEQAAF